MKRLLFFFTIMAVPYNFDCRAEFQSSEREVLAKLEIPMLESDDNESADEQELLQIVQAAESPVYMRWIMEFGSQATARLIYLQRSFFERYSTVRNWWSGS